MDIETAKTLHYGEWLHHESQTQSGSECLRIRVNGKPQTWKTRPDEIRVPVRWGMRARDQFSLHNEELREWERESECRNDSHPKPVGLELFDHELAVIDAEATLDRADHDPLEDYHTHMTDDGSVSWSHKH